MKSVIKVGDTVEVINRIQRGKVLFINYYVVVEIHGDAAAYHPDELRLIEAENGEPEEEAKTGCEEDCLKCGKCFEIGPTIYVTPFPFSFSDPICPPRTICPVCHTNHEA